MDLLNALNSVNKPKTKTIVPSVEKVVPAKPKPVKKAKVKTEPPSSQTQTVFPSSETNAVKEEVVFHVPSNKEIKPSTPVHQTSKVTLVETPSSFSLDESSMNLETKKTRKSSNNKTNYSKIVSGITRVQRHNVLALMIQAVSNFRNRFDNTFEVDEIVCREFMTRLETRIFESVCMHKMPPCFNLYRSNLYKRVTHELIWSLRRNAKKLLSFEPEFLASLPAHMLIQGSACGTWYDDYIKRQADIKEREKQLREQRTEPAPEGHSKCPKCGCKMDMTMLQTRSADEPMTIFKNCVNCGYIIRK